MPVYRTIGPLVSSFMRLVHFCVNKDFYLYVLFVCLFGIYISSLRFA